MTQRNLWVPFFFFLLLPLVMASNSTGTNSTNSIGTNITNSTGTNTIVGDDVMQTVADDVDALKFGLDRTWMIMTGIGIFTMQLGFSLVEAGTIQAKSVQSVLLKNLTDNLIGGVTWYLLGYGIFKGEGSIVGRDSKFYLVNDPEHFAHFFQQYGFSVTACTIVSGAILGRVRFESYLIFSLFFLLYVYPIAAHVGWTDGFLAERGYVDFAGSGVIHQLGGFAAIVGATMVGPRVGRFYPKQVGDSRLVVRSLKITSVSLANLGGFLLYINWFHFNAGSTLGMSTVESQLDAGRAAVNTLIASSFAGAATTFFLLVHRRYQDVGTIMNSILTGLVAITAGCASVDTWAACIIGLLSSAVHLSASYLVLYHFNIDDPLEAFTVHGCGGALGVITTGLFHSSRGLLTTGETELFVVQMMGTVFYGLMGAVNAYVIFKIISFFFLLRISDEEQLVGLDIVHHDAHIATLDEYEIRERNLRKTLEEKLGTKIKKRKGKQDKGSTNMSSVSSENMSLEYTAKLTPAKVSPA